MYCSGSSDRSISLPQMSASATSSDTTVFFETRTRYRPGRAGLAQRPDEAQHLRRVAAGIDSVERVPHGALLVDDEGRAGDAGFPAAVRFLLVHDAVLPADLALGVGEQADRDPVLVAEPRVAEAVVGAHADHHAVVAGELLFVVGEIGRFQ